MFLTAIAVFAIIAVCIDNALIKARVYSAKQYNPRTGRTKVYYERPLLVLFGNDGPICLYEDSDVKFYEAQKKFTDKVFAENIKISDIFSC